MKKIPTLFVRNFINKNEFILTKEVTPGMEWVLEGKGIATVKIDGSCTAIINGEFYKRYDAKGVKKAPEGAIECDTIDPITGHHPYFVKVDKDSNQDKWYYEAYLNTPNLVEGTYEVIGPHFQKNPYHLDKDVLVKHGIDVVEVERSYEGIKKYLEEHYIEGLVFYLDSKPMCKIKRRDFGLPWNKDVDDKIVKPAK